jgi:hypothetical protein
MSGDSNSIADANSAVSIDDCKGIQTAVVADLDVTTVGQDH